MLRRTPGAYGRHSAVVLIVCCCCCCCYLGFFVYFLLLCIFCQECPVCSSWATWVERNPKQNIKLSSSITSFFVVVCVWFSCFVRRWSCASVAKGLNTLVWYWTSPSFPLIIWAVSHLINYFLYCEEALISWCPVCRLLTLFPEWEEFIQNSVKCLP